MVEITLGIEGTISTEVRRSLSKSFDGRKTDKWTLTVFVSYSPYDIPVGTVFHAIKLKGEIVFQGHFMLTFITQQMDLPCTEIPHGWPTICEFYFEDELPAVLLSNLSELNGWNRRADIEFIGKTEKLLPF